MVRTRSLFMAVTVLLHAGCDCSQDINGGLSCKNELPSIGTEGPPTVIRPTCGGPQRSCNGSNEDADGCETNTLTDASHCGGCGTQCPGGSAASCAAGACTLACAPGQLACAAGCVVPATDAANCGACGVACAGACREGRCTGEVVLTTKDPPFGLVCQGDAIVWSSFHIVARAQTDGTGVTTLATRGGYELAEGADRVAASGPDDGAFTVAITGGPTTVLAPGPAVGFAIAADDAYVYFIDDAGVRRAPTAGGATELVVDIAAFADATPLALALDDGLALYVGTGHVGGESSRILRVPLSPLGPPALFGPELGDVFPTLTAEGGAVFAKRQIGRAGLELVRIDGSDVPPLVLASVGHEGGFVRVIGGSVFWSDGPDLLELSLTRPGARPVALAFEPGGIGAACLAGSDLYLTAPGDLAIKRVPRGE